MMPAYEKPGSERVFLSREEAIGGLAPGDDVHVFVNPSAGMMIGADWAREDLIAAMEGAVLDLGGPSCASVGHAIVITTKEGRRLFAANADGFVERMAAALDPA